MNYLRFSIFLLVLGWASSTCAQSYADTSRFVELLYASSIRCNFEETGLEHLDIPASQLRYKHSIGSIRFDSIDPRKSRARVTHRSNPVPVSYYFTVNGFVFIELSPEGYLSLTRIGFEDSLESGKYPAIHSRYMSYKGKPFIASAYGSCAPLGSKY